MASSEAGPRPTAFRLYATALKAGAAVIALLTVTAVTAADLYASTRPVAALAWSPINAEASSRWASQALMADKADANAHARVMAQAALSRDATSVDGWRTLAEIADREGDEGLARRRYALIERFTRRDQPTHLWLANDSLRHGKTAAAIEQLDLALRTSESNWDRFLPMMVAATADASVIEPLLRRVQSAPNWRDPFMARMVASAPNLANAARIAWSLDWRVPAQREWIGVLLQRMANQGEYDLAWKFYAHQRGLSGAHPPAAVVDGDFENTGQYPFGWELVDQDGLSAQRGARPGGKGDSLLLGASDGHSGSVARQLLALPQGGYRISARMGGRAENTDERPTVTLTCAGGTSPLAGLHDREAGTTDAGRIVTAEVEVPAGCAWQWLAVEVSGGDDTADAMPWVDDVVILASRDLRHG